MYKAYKFIDLMCFRKSLAGGSIISLNPGGRPSRQIFPKRSTDLTTEPEFATEDHPHFLRVFYQLSVRVKTGGYKFKNEYLYEFL